MARKRVLITGAAGYLSRQLLPVFRERYDLVLLENIHIRIVVPRAVEGAKLASNQITYKRDLAGYISERDLQQLYMKSIETPDIRNADGVPWHCFYGVSDNTRSCWSIVNARQVIGYTPQDDSERVFADEIARFVTSNGRTAA